MLLAAPMIAAGTNVSAGAAAATTIALAPFLAWMAAALLPLWQSKPQTGRTVGRLLAGIVLANCLQVAAVAPSWSHAAAFTVLFGLTLWLQRRVPAT
jgi:hypothetical protein